ncbi:MAG: HAMP domain-containing sensor histidine kinase [Desulfobacteraceae bacterium]|jgi:signal transduction histidine kinase|nr:HAMP domain-containing sensor histidine kinase [Desulfobacteraceae bacterium]
MPKNWLNKILRSVFTKLLIVILLTGIAVNLVVGGFFWMHRSAAFGPLYKNVLQYTDYIISDLGTPPSLEKARQIAEQASLRIYFEGPNQSWATAGEISDFQKVHWRSWSKNPVIRVGQYRGHHFVEVKQDSGRFVFGLDKSFEMDPERIRLVVILLSLLTLILTGAFLTIRWILKPVRWLDEGVREVSRGNLKHRVPLKRSDELRDLAEGFNNMTDRIRDMLSTKEQLLLDVSHELRSPLTRAKVALEFLSEGKARDSIAGDISEMEKMIKDILETARMHHLHGKLKLQQTKLAELLQDILPDYEKQPPGIQLDEFSETLVINVDPGQIKTVFKNIVSNAIKYSNAASDPVRITVNQQAHYTVVQIADNGIGIPVEEISFIFEPFYRVDKSRSKATGGYGLGLSLCKTIMDAHDGKIEVTSKPGEGTTVSLFFPM